MSGGLKCSWILHNRGMTLTEVVVSLGISAILFGGIILGYIQSVNRAEWSALNFAGYSLAMQKVEQCRAAKWDTQAYPVVDQLQPSNFPTVVDILDIPISGSNICYATTYVNITLLSEDPPLKMITVNTVWSFKGRNYTNSVIAYRAPDQ
ncbi:MAG: type IV pilus modification PilV family protein [Limisphaerales bacterium]